MCVCVCVQATTKTVYKSAPVGTFIQKVRLRLRGLYRSRLEVEKRKSNYLLVLSKTLYIASDVEGSKGGRRVCGRVLCDGTDATTAMTFSSPRSTWACLQATPFAKIRHFIMILSGCISTNLHLNSHSYTHTQPNLNT